MHNTAGSESGMEPRGMLQSLGGKHRVPGFDLGRIRLRVRIEKPDPSPYRDPEPSPNQNPGDASTNQDSDSSQNPHPDSSPHQVLYLSLDQEPDRSP